MECSESVIAYDIAGIRYTVTGKFSRHFTTPCKDGPYDNEWTLDEMTITLKGYDIDEALFSGLFVMRNEKFINVVDDMVKRLCEQD